MHCGLLCTLCNKGYHLYIWSLKGKGPFNSGRGMQFTCFLTSVTASIRTRNASSSQGLVHSAAEQHMDKPRATLFSGPALLVATVLPHFPFHLSLAKARQVCSSLGLVNPGWKQWVLSSGLCQKCLFVLQSTGPQLTEVGSKTLKNHCVP